MRMLKLLSIMMLTIAGTSRVSATGVESSMGGFKLQTCTEARQCLTVKAVRTQGSQFKPLHTLSNPEVFIHTDATLKSKDIVIKGDTGYIDLNENQLVIYKRNGKSLAETSINLSTLERFHSKQGDL